MKVTAFVRSARRKHTYDATRLFLDKLAELGGVETELVVLSDHKIGTCRDCQPCFANTSLGSSLQGLPGV